MSIGVFVRLKDEETWLKFKKFVLEKHGKLHSSLGDELINAIKLYLETQCTHTHKTQIHEKPKLKSRSMETLMQIAERITSEYENEIPQTEVERIIAQIAGADGRTLRKYTRLLIEYDVLKRDRPIAGTKPLKFIFKVNGYANRIR